MREMKDCGIEWAGAIGISDSRGKASPGLNVLDTEQNK